MTVALAVAPSFPPAPHYERPFSSPEGLGARACPLCRRGALVAGVEGSGG